jgi:CBS domain-containing protein
MTAPLSQRLFSLRPTPGKVRTVAELVEHLREHEATKDHSADKRRVIVGHPEDSVASVHRLFRSLNLHHLPVVVEDRVVGIVSSSDLLDYFSNPKKPACDTTTLQEIMTKDPTTVGKDSQLDDVIKLLAHSRFRCVPVVGLSGEIWAIVTTRDLVRFLALSYQ